MRNICERADEERQVLIKKAGKLCSWSPLVLGDEAEKGHSSEKSPIW